MNDPNVSAILVAWNSGNALRSCVDSLRLASERAEITLQLVVVDNGSTDGAVGEIQLGHGDVVVSNPVNVGFGTAAAQGLTRSQAPWSLLVNPDVIVEERFFQALCAAARAADDDTAVLVPEIRAMANTGVVIARGIALDEIGVPAEVDLGARVEDEVPEREVLGGSSGCCLLRLEAVKAVGGPEPLFFAYLEDVDLAVRLQRAGYKALLVPTAVAWHEGSASTGQDSPIKVFLVARNRRLLFRLHGPRSIRASLHRLLVDAGHALLSTVTANALAPWLGRLDAVRLRRYASFLRRARAEHDAQIAEIQYSNRYGMLETLRRKRAAGRLLHR